MAKVETKYNLNDIVWWRTRGKAYSGKITSTEVVIDRFGTRITYTVLVNYQYKDNNSGLPIEYYETINENEIYKREVAMDKEAEKE